MVSISERLKEAVRDVIEKPLHSEGCELAELVISQYKKGSTVRLFIYCENGVTLGKCASLSSLVGAVIDGTDLFVNGYTLEISSPGLDRPLSNVVDYKYRIGETVKLNFAKRNRPAVRAKIVSVSDSKIVFENENGSFTEELTNIEKAKIVY